MSRFLAANHVATEDGVVFSPGVVRINNKEVTHIEKLDGERPFTEWLGGEITVRRMSDGTLRAYKDEQLLIDYE